jgi:hypothetical protein
MIHRPKPFALLLALATLISNPATAEEPKLCSSGMPVYEGVSALGAKSELVFKPHDPSMSVTQEVLTITVAGKTEPYTMNLEFNSSNFPYVERDDNSNIVSNIYFFDKDMNETGADAVLLFLPDLWSQRAVNDLGSVPIGKIWRFVRCTDSP